jgi:nucleoside phosphorylase
MMTELLEAIDRWERPRAVVMVGMMAGVRGKANLLDVVIPRTVFDGTAVGTREGAVVAEPEAADIDPRLHHWVTNYDWGADPRTKMLTLLAHKKTVTVAAKIDDISHELAKAAIGIDKENVVGLEMEGIALADRQKRQPLLGRSVAYLMVKGVADFAGHEATAEDVASLPPHLRAKARDNPNPVMNRPLRAALQREATRRSMAVAVTILASDVV